MKQDSSTDFCTAISPRVSSDNQYVNSFVADLRERRYADITIRKYLEVVRKFSHWLEQHHLCPAELADAVINRYLTCPCGDADTVGELSLSRVSSLNSVG